MIRRIPKRPVSRPGTWGSEMKGRMWEHISSCCCPPEKRVPFQLHFLCGLNPSPPDPPPPQVSTLDCFTFGCFPLGSSVFLLFFNLSTSMASGTTIETATCFKQILQRNSPSLLTTLRRQDPQSIFPQHPHCWTRPTGVFRHVHFSHLG